jgi:hypothetical protein
MRILSFDCANKSLAVCGVKVNTNKFAETLTKINECRKLIDQINLQIKNCTSGQDYKLILSQLKQLAAALKEIIKVFISAWVCEYQLVVDLFPGKKVKDTSPVERCVLLKSALAKIDYECDYVVIENQMRINEKSTGVLYCLLYEYGPKANIIMPSEKNKLNLGGVYRCDMIAKYSSAWSANKAHSKGNFEIIAKEQGFTIPKKCVSDIADAYFQSIAWYILCHAR